MRHPISSLTSNILPAMRRGTVRSLLCLSSGRDSLDVRTGCDADSAADERSTAGGAVRCLQTESAKPLMSRIVACHTSGIASRNKQSPAWHVPFTVRLTALTPASSNLR